MNNKHRITIFATIMATSFTVSAQEVFEKVDPQGGVEFSDQPSPGAKTIHVKPNVVNVNPVKSIEPTAPAAGVTETPSDSTPPEVIRDGGTANFYDDDEDRKSHKKSEKRIKQDGKAVIQPVHKGGGEAVRGKAQAR